MKHERMQPVWAFATGVLFSIGLIVGGMTQPAKVLALMDFPGEWDPSLPFVMLGGIAVYAPLRLLMRRLRRCPTCDVCWHEPDKRRIDAPLIGGAILFGVGWGLAGLCPGPALVSLGTLRAPAIVFVAAMIAGMHLLRLQRLRAVRRRPGG